MIWHFDMMLNILRIVLGVLGNLTATAFFISPMSTFVIICRKRDTQSFSGVSYLASMFNCILWVWYGMPFITKNNILLLSINALGATLESVYISLFITFAPRKEKLKALSTVLLELMLFSVIATLSLLIIPPTKKELFVGSISAVITTLMYAAPLSIMRMVIETKSVEFMPFWPSFLVIINSTIWLFYGLFGRDFFVLIPNAVGSLLGTLQLILYVCYRKSTNSISTTIINSKTYDIEGSLENFDDKDTDWDQQKKIDG